MDSFIVALRVLHIAFGVFWAGTTFFNVLILEPRLRHLGPNFRNPVLNALMPVLAPSMMLSALVVLGTGVALTLMVWTSPDTLLETTTGWILLAGFAFTLAAILVGAGILTPTGKRLGRVARSIEGRAPHPDEAAELTRLGTRIETFSRVNFVLLLLAVGTMTVFRYL